MDALEILQQVYGNEAMDSYYNTSNFLGGYPTIPTDTEREGCVCGGST